MSYRYSNLFTSIEVSDIKKPEIITRKRGIKSSGENNNPLLKLSFFCEKPFLFNK